MGFIQQNSGMNPQQGLVQVEMPQLEIPSSPDGRGMTPEQIEAIQSWADAIRSAIDRNNQQTSDAFAKPKRQNKDSGQSNLQ